MTSHLVGCAAACAHGAGLRLGAARVSLLGLFASWVLLGLAGCAAPQGDQPSQSPSQQQSASRASVIPDSPDETEERRRARIRLELASNYYQQRNYTVALDELRLAIAADGSYAPAYGMLGLVYMDLGDQAKADESFQRALRLAPGDSEINNNYGWFLCQSGKPAASIEYFVRAARDPLYRTPARPWHNAGICALRAGDEANAEQYFQRSFQVEPSNPVAMFNLGEIYLKRKNVERARFYSQRLMSTYAPTAGTLWLALRIERLAGNRDAEASLSTQLRRRFPASEEANALTAGKYGD